MVVNAQIPVKVKNTFIDIDEKFIEYDNEDDEQWLVKDTAMRQMSAPAPSIVRQTSERSPLKGILKMMEQGPEIAEEEEDEEDPSEPVEPELEPKRQSSAEEDLEPTMSWERMVTGGSLCGFDAPLPGATGMASMAGMKVDDLAQPLWPMYMMFGPPGSEVPYNMDYAGAGPAAMAASMAPAMPLKDTGGAMVPPAEWANVTTVMMRNLPNKYTQEGLIQEINEAGFLGTFDFFYLPIDPETGANRGYVFINFVEPSYAWLFRTTYEGRRMSSSSKSRKVISVTPAALQGFDANFAHYSSARCIRGDVTARPLFLRAPAEDPSSSDAAVSPKPGRRRRRGGGRSAIDLAVRRQRQDALEGQKIEPQEEAKQAPALEGAPASSTVPQWQEEAKAGPSEVSFCHSCGAELRSHFQFCSSCGSAVARSGMLPMAAMAQNQESVCQHPMAAIAQAQEGLCTQASADAMCYYVAPRVMQPAFAKNAQYVF
mmetsp:Transcript_106518/g.237777  ORF Transcript_106518/g.237777 Transcript_106518/m.237777 type:complete len:485 (-) Transcript_106518:76-1530(-)